MMKLICICLLSMAVLLPVSGASSTRAMIINDMFTFGLGSNPDDLRSYGAAAAHTFPSGFTLELSSIGLTNRYGAQQQRGRIDEIRLTGRYELPLAESPCARAYLTPEAGIVLAGPLGYQWAQNTIHRVLDIKLVDITYDNEGSTTVHPLFGARLAGELRYPRVGHPDLTAKAVLYGHSAPGWEHKIGTDVLAGWKKGSQFLLAGGLSYLYRLSSTDSISHQELSTSDSGWGALIESRAGIITTSARLNRASYHGYGAIGITLSSREYDPPDGPEDLRVTHGFLIPVIAHTITLRYPLTKHLGATASLNYYSRSVEGKPQRENFSSWMAGADTELPLPDIPAALFAALQGGLRHILILDYQQGSAQPQELLDEYRLTAAISGGVRLFHLGELQIQGVSYGVELAGGMQFGTAGSAEIEEHWKGMRELKPLVPFASLGVTAGFSWGR